MCKGPEVEVCLVLGKSKKARVCAAERERQTECSLTAMAAPRFYSG